MKKPSVPSEPASGAPYALAMLTAAPLPFVLAAPGDAPAAATIKAQLQAFKVTVEKDGDEKLGSASVAKPGDIIEYQATYSNDGQRAATNLNATLPIPAALSYVPNTASPGGFMASTDAQNFAPAPLKRAVKGKDGKTVMVMVPFSEYRALRWNVKQLAPGDDFKVSARASVRRQGGSDQGTGFRAENWKVRREVELASLHLLPVPLPPFPRFPRPEFSNK